MAELTQEQKRVLAVAQARARLAASPEAQPAPPQERTFKDAVYDNIIGNPDDGVNSFGERVGTWLNRAGESATLGVVGDEASAAATGLLPGRSYEGELERYRENEENMSGFGRLSADLSGGIIPAFAGVGAVAKAPTVMRAIGRGLGLGAGAGATQGFMEGEGDVNNRVQSGAMGATIGGVLGGAIPAAGALGSQLVRGVKGAARNSAVGRSIGEALNVSPQTGRIASRLIGEGNPNDMAATLQRSGPSAMLADATPGTAGMLDATMRNPAPGAALARGRVDQRASQSYYNVVDALAGGQQGPRMPPVANQTARRTGARATINPLYQKAYDTPINYDTPEGRAVEDILTRAPRGMVRDAVKKAQDRMIYDGFPDQQIMARFADDGSVTFDEMPNTMMADYIKRAFDEVAEDSKDAITGAMSSEGQFANRVARDLRGALADAVPGYDEALSAASTDIRGRAAVRTGQSLLRPNTTVEEISEAIADATPAELRAMREGVMGQIEHIMGNVRAAATDQNVDARQAMKLFGDLSSPNSKQKMRALFGDQFDAISQQLDEAGAALRLRSGVASNSATQPRMAADQMISEEVAPGAVRSLQPLQSARELGQRALGSDPASVARLSDDVKGELADLLSRPGGAQNLSSIVQALSANPMRANVGRGTNRAITGAGFTGLPTVTDALRRRLPQ